MSDKSLCRIGVFYDGSYFTIARNHYFHDRKLGWLEFQPLHLALENEIRDREKSYSAHKVVYASWFQGLFDSSTATHDQLRRERGHHLDLLHAGIDPRYVPMATNGKEKGVDVALAIDALQAAFERKIDIAVLITGDGDLVPLTRALMKHGVQAMVAYFDCKGDKPSYANDRLLRAAAFSLNISALENEDGSRAIFRGLFRL